MKTAKRKLIANIPVWRPTPEGAFVCGDSAEEYFLIRAGVGLGFDLVGFDQWVATLDAGGPRDRALRLRARAKAETQLESMAPYIEAMLYLCSLIARDDVLQPLAVDGDRVRRARRLGGAATAKQRSDDADESDAKIARAARALLAANPRMSHTDVAIALSERGYGSVQVIRKKLPRLLAR